MSIKNGLKKIFKEKKVALLGLGAENFSLARLILADKIDCALTVCDARAAADLGENYRSLARRNITWRLAENVLEHFDGFDIIVRSPGWPLFDPAIKEALGLKVALTSPMAVFFVLCPSKNIIGVTGTKGKGTTASLIHSILRRARRRCWLGGNIGIAPFDFITRIKKNDWVILELSSFQLEDLKQSPRIAVMTNFFPEHLAPADPLNPNYHRSIRDYWQAKANIFRWQKRRDVAVINEKLRKRAEKTAFAGHIIYFGRSDRLSRLPGEHNRENIASAALAAAAAGARESEIATAVKSFRGLPHRLELVARFSGVSWYNDSFATTPESAITALRSFKEPVVLIAGGAEKNSSFKKLARAVKARAAAVILLSGAATGRLKKEFRSVGYPIRRLIPADSMLAAVYAAKKAAPTGGNVVLSPACASFGLFRNYKERGDQFRQAVRLLKKKQNR